MLRKFISIAVIIALIVSKMRMNIFDYKNILLIRAQLPILFFPTSTPNQVPSNAINPSIVASLIGALGVICGSLITGILLFYQIRRTGKLEQEKMAIQKELDHEKIQSEKEIIRIQDEIAAERIAKERERLQQEDLEKQEQQHKEEQRIEDILNQSTNQYVQNYLNSICTDPRISRLQILDMSRPLEVMSIYVRLRLYQESRSRYELAQGLILAEARRDPNELLRANQVDLETRFSSALDPIEAIRAYAPCVIVGDPGAGKTTLLKYLALKSANQQLAHLPNLPIHVELNAFVSSSYDDLLDFISSRWEERYGFPKRQAREYIEKSLESGQALLLLDALDETMVGDSSDAAEASYNYVADIITKLMIRYYKSPIVVTARKAGYQQRKPLEGFTELEVLDFRQEDIKKFVEKWFACHPNPKKRINADHLNACLTQNSRIQALAANPLLLSLIAIVYEAQLDLPDRRAELYKLCIETLLTKWDATRDIRRRREFKPEHKRQLLQEIAWHFHMEGRRYFPDEELLEVIANFLPAIGLPSQQNHKVLDEITSVNGLIKEQARGWHGFLHLTLQEYFAAQYAADSNLIDDLLEHVSDPWWEEVILLYSGCTPDASLLLQKLLEAGGQYALILAGRCLAAHPTVRKTSLRESVTSHLLNFLKTSSAPLEEQVLDTLVNLVEIGGAKVDEHLLAILQDNSVYKFLQLRIISTLGQLGDRSIIPHLFTLLQDSTLDKDLRIAIAYALGQLGDRSAIPELLSLLQDTSLSKKESETIASALGLLDDRSAITNLVSLLQDHNVDKFLRLRIIDTLGQLGDHTVIPNLLLILQDINEDKDLKLRSVEALDLLSDPAVVPHLLPLLQAPTLDKELRISIAFTLGQLGDRSAIPGLHTLLQDPHLDKDLQINVIDTLGQLGDRSVIPSLHILLQDPHLDKNLCKSISYSLGHLDDRTITSTLLSMLQDGNRDKDLRISILDILGQLGDRSVIPTLLPMLQDNNLDKEFRKSIAYSLGQLGDRSVIPTLLPMLQDNDLDKEFRKSIAYSLGQLGDRSVIPTLLSMLRSPDLNKVVRTSIAETLNRLEND